MNKQTLSKVALLFAFLGPALAIAQTSDRPDGMRFVPDVPGQFQALTDSADALGFHIGGSPNPSACKHYQAITRVDGPDGTPFFLVTRSGLLPDTVPLADVSCDDSPGETSNGNLIVFKMDSRDKNGERLRSNRLRKGVHVDDTPPPPEDKATIYFTVVDRNLVFQDGDGAATPRAYQHPGGMQLVGHMLAIAVESPRDPLSECISACFGVPMCIGFCNEIIDYEVAPNPTLVMFVDVSNPEAPQFTSQFAPTNTDGIPLTKCGFVGVTPLPRVPEEDKNRYLAVLTGGEHPDHLFFYRSSPDDLSSSNLTWEPVGTTPYPDVADAHQTMQFLREGDINGDLYLAGIRGNANTVLHNDRDKIDLRLVQCRIPGSGDVDPYCTPGNEVHVALTFASRLITPHPSTGGTRLVNFAAASGFYVSPSGELIMYATEHENDGPDRTVKAGEWRHIDMARADSPTHLPSVVVNGPYEVDEGGTVELTGSAGPPITKAWIEPFHEVDFGGQDFSTSYPVVGYDDYFLDDFDDFVTLELQPVSTNPDSFFTHNNKARSWKWFAPEGCSIRATDHRENNSIETRTLVGDGLTHGDPDLTLVLNDHGHDGMGPGEDGKGVDAVEFLSGCDTYYTAPVELQWDRDVDTIYEITGSPVPFNAIAFDGPSVVQVPAQAVHSRGGLPGQTTARVTVHNVAPALAQFSVTNGAGQQVNVDVPFLLTDLPVTVGADFSDPGVLDLQTATLDWGDGTVDPNSAFAIFDEAFGDGTGAVSQAHIYTLPGSYTIALSVLDDDGGADAESADVRVLTPEQAVEEVLDMLDGVIAGTTDSEVLKELLKARKALVGSVKGESANGALAMIRADYDDAAIAFMLEQAIFRLRLAQDGGADVGTLIALLEQIVAALAAS